MTTIYVGNLPYGATDEDLRRLFEPYGPVESAAVAVQRNGRSRGFGLVVLSDPAAADRAIGALNGKELDGRSLTVNESRPRRSVRDRQEQWDAGHSGDRRGRH